MTEYRNALRSKRLIREAFAQLIKERQDISKITVSEIVKDIQKQEAMLVRSTRSPSMPKALPVSWRASTLYTRISRR